VATYGTFVDGNTLKASEANDFLVWKTLTPSVFQPSSLSTNGDLRYSQVNKLVIAQWSFLVINPGTANTRIEINLPVTATSATNNTVIGSGFCLDITAPGNIIRFSAVQYSTTRVAFLSNAANSTTAYLGTTAGGGPTLANQDSIKAVVMYEAA
jgi:hypothetical protein